MKPTRFAYLQPASVREVVSCLQANEGEARILAGGQSLIPLLNSRRVRPSALVDLKRLRHLRYLAHGDQGLRIGPLTRHVDIERLREPEIRSAFGVLPEVAGMVGHAPIRTRGTFGGTIAHADPCSEWCLLAVLLDAEITVEGITGARVIHAADFFTGRHCTAARWDEVVVDIRFPRPAPSAALAEFAFQRYDLPVVAASATVELDAHGRITSARVALAGVADRPVRVAGAEDALQGGVPSGRLFDHMAKVVTKEIDPVGDVRAGALYRRELAASLVMRALRTSVSRAVGHNYENTEKP